MEVAKQALTKALSDLYVREDDFKEIIREYIDVSSAALAATYHILSDRQIMDRERQIQSARRVYFTLG